MFKLVVLFAALAVASAKPGLLASGYLAPSAYYGGVSAYSAPLVSAYGAHPVVSSYAAAPVVSAYSHSPLAYAAPAYAASAYAAPAFAYGEPALYPGSPAGVVKATGKLVDTADVVVARNNHYVAKTLNAHGIHKRSAIAPLAYSNVYSSPLVSAYSRPLAYSAYSAPLVSAYSTSVVNPGYGIVPSHAAYGVHGVHGVHVL
ncbi:uncharacterized protein LOC143914450 [Arctopsyche grandis]|uniref:uncharacterized protein LOC143914450 n=1 Tax=Arctopsyche grandis TaxID=121162 RepID=UPI00406D84AC